MESTIKETGSQEISPAEKKIAISLESFPHLEFKDRVFLVLVWKGFKTASAISLELGFLDDNDLEERVKKASLFLKPDRIIDEEMYGLKPGKVYFIANNQQDLDLISEKWFGNQIDDPNVYREIGRMSGFPQTAKDAYDTVFSSPESDRKGKEKELFISEDEKRELLKLEPDLLPFAFLLYMSRENFQTELETVRKWAKTIRFFTPALYGAFISDFKIKEARRALKS